MGANCPARRYPLPLAGEGRRRRDGRDGGFPSRANDPLAYNPYTYHFGTDSLWHGACDAGIACRTEEVSWYQARKARQAPASGQESLLEAL
jgi:hypothetical protein